MKPSDIATIAILVVMTLVSGLLGYEFHRSTDYGKFRSLWIYLFASKTYLYGATAIYFTGVALGYFAQLPLAWVLLAINIPTFIAKVRLYVFVRWGK